MTRYLVPLLLILFVASAAVFARTILIRNPQPATAGRDTPAPTGNTSYTSYVNVSANYSLEYPKEWEGSTGEIPTDFEAQSPDYLKKQGLPGLQSGAVISVQVRETAASDISMFLASDPTLNSVARNKRDATIAGQPAVSYRYDYQATLADNVTFIYDGRSYLLQYRYADPATRSKYLPHYQHMLDTFSLQEPK